MQREKVRDLWKGGGRMIDFFFGFLSGLICFYFTLEVMLTLIEKRANKYIKEKEGGEE